MYTTQQQIEDELGGYVKVAEALDDSGSGDRTAICAVLERVMQRASAAVDGFLAGRYVVPLSPVPALATEAAVIFTCEIIFNRRRQTLDDKNPYTARADILRQELKDIADRKKSLDAKERPAFAPGAANLEYSRLNGSGL